MRSPFGDRVRLSGLVLFVLACAVPPEQVSLAIMNVTVIDPEHARVLPDHSVYIVDGRIRAVEPSGERSRYVADDTVDGTGQFLVPGLIDSHSHLGQATEQVETTFALLIANGVTGVRALGADCWDAPRGGALCAEGFRALADEIAAGRRVGPRLLSLSSPAINGVAQRDALPAGSQPMFAPGTADEGRALARHLSERGVDLAKVYNSVPREAYFALLAEASELGLEVSGHIPSGVSVVEASNAGQRTIEHARDLPVACSTYGAEYRARMNDVVEGVEDATAPASAERISRSLDGFDAALCSDVLSTLRSNGTYLVPTHGTREMDARAGESAYRDDPRLKYIRPGQRRRWTADLDRYASSTPETVALYREFYDAGLRLTARAQAAGVNVLIGTDTNDTMIFPGFGVHDEMARFAQAGIAPMDILRAATSVPAGYLGRAEDLGGIAAGKLADLVLLGRRPPG